jgi:hypothetical protein
MFQILDLFPSSNEHGEDTYSFGSLRRINFRKGKIVPRKEFASMEVLSKYLLPIHYTFTREKRNNMFCFL